MNFLLFDEDAISVLIKKSDMQSIEYENGRKLVDHFCGRRNSELLSSDLIVQYVEKGILFLGIVSDKVPPLKERRIYCVDLTSCNILAEADHPSDFLTVMQRSFRTVVKIWNRQPFSSSERINGTKSIIFPFVIEDRRRLVIERSVSIPRLEKRGIKYPLLAYKYSAESPKGNNESVDFSVIKSAGDKYVSMYYELQKKYRKYLQEETSTYGRRPLETIRSSSTGTRDDFIFWEFNEQYEHLTEAQKYIVDYMDLASPLRVDGAAGTGKTLSLIMRAYSILQKQRGLGKDYNIIFFAHSESTRRRNHEIFELYADAEYFLDSLSPQHIRFVTLFDFCKEFGRIEDSQLIEKDAGDAKTYQLMMIENVIEDSKENGVFRTYYPLLSQKIKDSFDAHKTPVDVLCKMLQHEFGVQIKGRTDCTIENYCELKSIKNGLPCDNKKDKEFIFRLFTDYQHMLSEMGQFDVDDITLEASGRLNGPIWRRDRLNLGYDYIFADEMHLFNINEQSIFHLLTKDSSQRTVPICFALDYGQAIGDRGDKERDYCSTAFGSLDGRKYKTVFRNSQQIMDFCAAVSASGTLMFNEDFMNPYAGDQIAFTESEERISCTPYLRMFDNDEEMLYGLKDEVVKIRRALACNPGDIAIVTFDDRYENEEQIKIISKLLDCQVDVIDSLKAIDASHFVIVTPHMVNGLEFKAVILLGVDEGRVPQKFGTSDVSQNFIKYSAFNMLYLSASRAKYRLVLMGNKLNGVSSCLEYAISHGILNIVNP